MLAHKDTGSRQQRHYPLTPRHQAAPAAPRHDN
jgi:hypothetical protein